MDILKTFLELTQYTYTLGEEYLLKDKLPKDVKTDEIGNYFLKIGESETMFCSHLDTAAFIKEKVIHVELRTKKRKQLIISTDGTTLLGADDKAGVVIMLNMIEKNVPGLYYFFIGEESGLVGSKGILDFDEKRFKNYKRCISFDRKGFDSVITYQMGARCCSNEFADSLISEFKKNGLTYKKDPTGVFTDSAIFDETIPECTNISVGYFDEHTEHEYQNMYHLSMLAEAATKIDWESLTVSRKILDKDTPDPVRKPKKPGDLTDDQLEDIFFDVDDLLEEYLDLNCINFDKFMPEKEMIYSETFNKGRRVSVFIHENGSITIGKETFNDFKSLKEVVELYYGHDDEAIVDVDEQFPPEDDESIESVDNIEELSKVFINKVDIADFYEKIENLTNKNNTGIISALEMSNILDKYNLRIESLIMWLYSNDNNPIKTGGLYWDNGKDKFVYTSA